jgi:hypothetical protein
MTTPNDNPGSRPPRRPKGYHLHKMVPLHFKVTPALKERIAVAASRRGMLQSNWIRSHLIEAANKELGKPRYPADQLPLTGTDGGR